MKMCMYGSLSRYSGRGSRKLNSAWDCQMLDSMNSPFDTLIRPPVVIPSRRPTLLKRFSAPILAAVASVTILIAGCATTPHPADSTANPAATDTSKPILAAAMAPTTSPAFPASQPAEVVAELSTTKITKADLDKLLYQTYGLQMVFDLIELDLAKNTLLVQQNKTLQQADIDRERDIVFSQMFKKADKADYDSYFAQFLQKEKIKREEFDIRAIQTSACLR